MYRIALRRVPSVTMRVWESVETIEEAESKLSDYGRQRPREESTCHVYAEDQTRTVIRIMKYVPGKGIIHKIPEPV